MAGLSSRAFSAFVLLLLAVPAGPGDLEYRVAVLVLVGYTVELSLQFFILDDHYLSSHVRSILRRCGMNHDPDPFI